LYLLVLQAPNVGCTGGGAGGDAGQLSIGGGGAITDDVATGGFGVAEVGCGDGDDAGQLSIGGGGGGATTDDVVATGGLGVAEVGLGEIVTAGKLEKEMTVGSF